MYSIHLVTNDSGPIVNGIPTLTDAIVVKFWYIGNGIPVVIHDVYDYIVPESEQLKAAQALTVDIICNHIERTGNIV